jgi:hypothetical protein
MVDAQRRKYAMDDFDQSDAPWADDDGWWHQQDLEQQQQEEEANAK